MPVIRDSIAHILEILRTNLDQGINALVEAPNPDVDVVLANIALADAGANGNSALSDRIVITLLKVEEEAALKNQPAYRRNPVTGVLEVANPPVFLNLYLLITANYSNYGTALGHLSRVIGYFQYKKVFVDADAEVQNPVAADLIRFNFNINLLSPTFEQINHIWGVLGGKLLPSALYKMQLVQLEYVPDEAQEAPLVQIVELGEKLY